MGMEKRMNDASFDIGTPICSFCKNIIRHPFDINSPHAPLFTCAKLGMVPDDIVRAKLQRCGSFEVNLVEYEIYKPLLPKDLKVDEISK
jgi:hypothetical protein